MRFSARTLAGLLAALLIVVLVPFLWLRMSERPLQTIQTTSTSQTDSTSATVPKGVAPQSNSTATQDLSPKHATSPNILPQDTTRLLIPVTGVKSDQLVDTYAQARSNGRIHDAIDIVAPHNSPVVAAAAGQIVRLFQSRFGGTTIYELSPDGHTVYYYAHLDHYAEGLAEEEQVQQGQVLGYVGDTGDAGPGNYHLHFAIWLIQDPKKFWDGENINPYPILRQAK